MAAKIIEYVVGQVIFVADDHTAPLVFTDQDLKIFDRFMQKQLASTTASLLHVVMDERKLVAQPSIQVQIQQEYVHLPKLGWIVVVNHGNVALRFISSVVAQQTKTRLRIVESIDEAFHFLQTIDDTLPNLLADEYRNKISTFE